MIRSILEFLYRNRLVKTFESAKTSLYKEFSDKEDKLRKELDKAHFVIEEKLAKLSREKVDLEEDENRVLDRKMELARVNNELKTQIRLIEAKASPDNVWVEAFAQGFDKAWTVMLPFMLSGIERAKEEIRNQEIDSSIPRLSIMVNKRIDELGLYQLKSIEEVYAKKNEFIARKIKAVDEVEKQKYDNFIQVINWILSRRNGN